MARPNERIQFWRGYSTAMNNVDILSGQILFQEDTGDVFLDYRETHPTLPGSDEVNPNYGQLIRLKLTDTDKANIYGDTFTGQVFLFPEYTVPIEDNEAVPKKYVDDIESDLQQHINTHVNNQEIHITQKEREAWNNKVDKEEGKGLSTNDFTDELKEKVERSTHVEYQSAYEVDEDNADEFYDLGTISIDDTVYHIYAPVTVDIAGNAGSADKLKDPVLIDGISFDGSKNISRFGICTTDVDVEEKEVYVENFELEHGSSIVVKFKESNDTDKVFLNISNTGKYPLWYGNANAGRQLKAGSYYIAFVSQAETGEPDHYVLVSGVDTQYDLVTSTIPGLMRPEDYEKLKTIEECANNYTLPTASNITLGGVKIGNNIYNDDGLISVRKEDIISALGYTPMSLEEGIDLDVLIETLGTFEGAKNGEYDETLQEFVNGEDGSEGLVPAPLIGDEFKFLSGAGTWEQTPYPELFKIGTKTLNLDYDPTLPESDPNYVPQYNIEPGYPGIVPGPTWEDTNKVLSSDGTWISIDTVSTTSITKEEIDEMLKDLNIGIGGGSCNCEPISKDDIQQIVDNSQVANLESITEEEIVQSFNSIFGGSNA